MRNLTGKTALITGGAGGIGLGMAQAFARAGMKIALADLIPERLDSALQNLRATGCEAMSVLLDVSDFGAWREAVDTVEEALGPVSLLCNNAGLGGGGVLAEADPVRWRMVVNVNLMGPFYGCRTLLPRMLARGDEAHIVNTASLSGLRSNAGMSAYDASKHGVVGMSDSLRAELKGTQVGLSVLYPGTVRTEFANNSAAIAEAAHCGAASKLDTEIAKLLKTGMDPNAVGDQVLNAVLEGRYHIYTHPNWRPIIEAHFGERIEAFGKLLDPAAAEKILNSLNGQIGKGLQ